MRNPISSSISLFKSTVFIVLLTFTGSLLGPLPVRAQEMKLPAPGVMVYLSPEFDLPILKGIKVHPDNPFRFDFILDKGDSQLSNNQLKDESSKLIKYFLASLTIPEKDLWVNLSPYEKDRIIPNSFGLTEMGRDLLAEDYMLKQITASLIYPEGSIGKEFWKKVYEQAQEKYHTTNIPVNTFNKVWIVPEKAVVYENAKAGTAYVVESKLKVMLEQDYFSLAKHEGIQSERIQTKDTNQLGSQIVREVVIPRLQKEVNEGKNFAQLRQVYNSLILATWYKKKVKDSLLAQVYVDKKKVAGVNINDPNEKEKIYQRYLQAFKKGVYNYIKEDVNPVTQETIPRKYFSGGLTLNMDKAMVIQTSLPGSVQKMEEDFIVQAGVKSVREMRGNISMARQGSDRAMNAFTQTSVPGVNQLRLPLAISSKFDNLQDAESAKAAFEEIRKAINDQERLRPFVFYHARISLDDMYGGPAMFESLIKLLEEDAVRRHYGLEALRPAGVTSQEEVVSQFKKDLGPLREIGSQLGELIPYLRGEITTDIYGDMVRNQIEPFLNKYFMNKSFSKENLIQFLRYLQNNFGLWDRDWDSFRKRDIDTFLEGLSKQGFIVKDKSPFIETTPELIRVLINKGFITNEEGQELNRNWSKLAEKYLILKRISPLELDTDSSGKKFFNPRRDSVSHYIPGEDVGKFVGDYYELTSAIYPLLSKVFFTIATDIEGRDYLPQGQSVGELGENWQVRALQSGYYRDWNNVWQKKSDQSPQPVYFLTFDGSTSQLRGVFEENPAKMVDVFIYAAQKGIFIDDTVLAAMRGVKIQTNKRISDPVGKSFVKFMGLEQKISPLLVRMHEIGLLDQMLPELAELNTHFPGKIHRFSLSYHTLYLLYYSENGMPELLRGINKENDYQHVMGDYTSRLILRFSMLLHDAEKDAEYQHLGRPHPVEGANSLVYRVLARFPRMGLFSDWIAWLVWHHQDLNARGRYSPPITLCHRDLLDIVSYKDIPPSVNSSLMDIWYLLTIADAYSVDPHPEEGKAFLSPQVHVLHKDLADYYNQSDSERKNTLKQWRMLASKEDKQIRDYYRNLITVSEIKAAFETFKPSISDNTLEKIEQKLNEEVDAVDPNHQHRLLLGQLPPQSYFKELYDEYAKLLPMIYLRELNVSNGLDMAHEMIMYALIRDSSDPNLLLSRAAQIETELGNFFNMTVDINQDRSGIMYKIMGLVAALGLNVVNSQVRTLVKSRTHQKVIVDQLEGYFLPGEVNFEAIWPQLEKLLRDKGVVFSKDAVYNEYGKPDVKYAIPILLKALLTEQEGQRLTIDDIFNIAGVENVFQKQQNNIKTKTRIKFIRDLKVNGGSASSCSVGTPDRNGLLYTIARIAGEGFRFNIETAPILTSRIGASDTFMFSKMEKGEKNGRALDPQEKETLTQWYKYFFDLPGYDNNLLQKAVEYIKTGKSLDQFRQDFPLSDSAMATPPTPEDRVRNVLERGSQVMKSNAGGIDLTPSNMNLQTQNNNGEIKS